MNLHQPLYAEEPRFLLLDRRENSEEFPDGSPNEDDPFPVTRGRRQYEIPLASESFLASMRTVQDLASDEERFRTLGNRRTENAFLESAEEPVWAARRKRNSLKFVEALRHRYGLPRYVPGNGPCWSFRGRRSATGDSRNVRGFLKSLPVEEPFWPARGKKSNSHGTEESRDRSGLLKSVSAEEPFWEERGRRSAGDRNEESRDRRRTLEPILLDESASITRGKQPVLFHCAQKTGQNRGLLESISAEDPSWVARGRRTDEEAGETPQRRGSSLDSLSAEDVIWNARGRRSFLDSLSTDEPFWPARGKKESQRITSPSPEELLSQVRLNG